MILVTDVLEAMRKHGSAVSLSWGEDNDAWECSWITGGRRHSGFAGEPAGAVLRAMGSAGFRVPDSR